MEIARLIHKSSEWPGLAPGPYDYLRVAGQPEAIAITSDKPTCYLSACPDLDYFRVADYSGVDAIFVNTRAFTVLIQSRLHRCW
jgi:hypothetical protein